MARACHALYECVKPGAWRDDLCVVRVSFGGFLDSDGTEPVPPVAKSRTRSSQAEREEGEHAI